MAQQLKNDVRISILDSAAGCFFEKGYLNTTLSDIAKRAGAAVGNLYRYFRDKEDIFYSALPRENLENMREMLEKKFEAARGLPVSSEKISGRAVQEEFINLISLKRKYWYVVLMKSEGTEYSAAKEEAARFIAGLFGRYMESVGNAPFNGSGDDGFLALQVYRALIGSFCAVLKEYEDIEKIKALCMRLLDYHFAGLEALFTKEE